MFDHCIDADSSIFVSPRSSYGVLICARLRLPCRLALFDFSSVMYGMTRIRHSDLTVIVGLGHVHTVRCCLFSVQQRH